jgi:hypothetical protein
MRTYINWSSRRSIAADSSCPAGVDADRSPVHRPQHRRPLGVAGRLHLHGAEAAGERVFNDLLDQGAKAVHSIGLFQRPPQSGELSCHVRDVVWSDAATHPNLPVHGGDAVLDHIDGAPHYRRLGKAAQIDRRCLGQQLCRKLDGAENRRQRQRPALRVRIRSFGGHIAAAPRSLPPDLPQLFRYFHAHLPFPIKKAHPRGCAFLTNS